MNNVRLALTALMFGALFAGIAHAQGIQTPSSVKPIGFTYDYYEIGQPETELSPSDIPPAEEAAEDEAVAPSNGYVHRTCHNCNGCAKCCNSCEEDEDECDEDECDGCDGGDDCGCPCYLFGPEDPYSLQNILFGDCECAPTIGGWIEYGYHSNNVPLSFNRGDLFSFGDIDNGQLNSAWLYLEREADGECGWDWGYRFDVMYGTDAQKTQAFGNQPDAFGNPDGWDNDLDNGVYGWAMPQAYIELAYGDLSIIGGHFFTLIGYEVVTAPDNFFYTHALTMFNSEPFTHTGVLATYALNDNVELYGGWTAGWDTGFDSLDGGSSWLGGASLTLTDNISFTYISTAGNFGLRGDGGYSHSLVFDVSLTDNLQWVVQSDFVAIERANPNGIAPAPAGTQPLANDQVGINQYMFYTINDCLALGTRLEWWKSDGISYHEVTGGINYKPHANLIIRPEVRYDWTPARAAATRTSAGAVYPVGVNDITTFSVSGILTF